MAHIDQTRRPGYFDGTERGFLACSLGFPSYLFDAVIPSDRSVSVKVLKDKLKSSGLSLILHRTFNAYGLEYNRECFRKAADLTSSGKVSFQQLQKAKVFFTLFEEVDLMGMVNNEMTVSRALKMCELVLAPTKLTAQLRQLRGSGSNRRGRIQMWEFFDIVSECESHSASEQPCPVARGNRDLIGLFPIADFDSILKTGDERTSSFLEDKYQQSRRKQHVDMQAVQRRPAGLIGLVKQTERRKRAIDFATASVGLWEKIGEAEEAVTRARAGFSTKLAKEKLCQQQVEHIAAKANASSSTRRRPDTAGKAHESDQAPTPVAAPKRDLLNGPIENWWEDWEESSAEKTTVKSQATLPEEFRLSPSLVVTDKDRAEHKARMNDLAWDSLMRERARRQEETRRPPDIEISKMELSEFSGYHAAVRIAQRSLTQNWRTGDS